MSGHPKALDYSAIYDPDADFDSRYTTATAARIAERICAGDRVMELGCATGLMTSVLAEAGGRVDAVERSPDYLDRARARKLPGATFFLADVEEYDTSERYAHVCATNVLHELAEPEVFVARCARFLAPGGLLYLTLQNPFSLHRLVAVEMGLLDDPMSRSARGGLFGSTRLFTADELVAMGLAAGLSVVERGGVMLKPLANAQLAELPEDVLDGLEKAARHLPENCAMTYLVLGRG